MAVMKNILRMFCLLICMALMLGQAGCADKTSYPKDYDTYFGILGETKADALKALKLQETELVEFRVPNSFEYVIPKTVTFGGFDFEIHLHVDPAFDRICGFKYYARTDDISALWELYEKLVEKYGAPGSEKFTQQLVELLANEKRGSVGSTWSLCRFTEDIHLEYYRCLEQFKETNDFSETIAWNLDLTSRYDEEAEKFEVELDFKVGRVYGADWQAGADRN